MHIKQPEFTTAAKTHIYFYSLHVSKVLDAQKTSSTKNETNLATKNSSAKIETNLATINSSAKIETNLATINTTTKNLTSLIVNGLGKIESVVLNNTAVQNESSQLARKPKESDPNEGGTLPFQAPVDFPNLS